MNRIDRTDSIFDRIEKRVVLDNKMLALYVPLSQLLFDSLLLICTYVDYRPIPIKFL